LLPGREIRNVLGSLRGKAMLFLDTCHAGDVVSGVKLRAARDFTRFINELRDTDSGVVVYSASTGAQQSQERAEWGDGAFTEALVEALAGSADLDGDRAIMIDELGHFLDRRVRTLTEGLQTPTMAKPNSIPNFPIALALDLK
jgi:uncharacterized caspase-like protein